MNDGTIGSLLGPKTAEREPRVVAFGGGHGLSASLSALSHLTTNLTAIVTVADDGGSSGRLRDSFGVLPPGDLRMALAALADDSRWSRLWRDLLQHRFTAGGDLEGHALGNLLIVALWERFADPAAGLEIVGRLLGAEGKVLPMSTVPLAIEADIERTVDGEPWRTTIRGQSKVARASGHVIDVRISPEDAPAHPEALAALDEADWIVLGPGSWYTSVIPHLLIPELARSIAASPARVCVTLNLSEQSGETTGYTAADHLRVLREYAPGLNVDVVIADPTAADDIDALEAAAVAAGGHLMLRQVSLGDGSARHDALRLAAAYRDAFVGTLGDVGRTG